MYRNKPLLSSTFQLILSSTSQLSVCIGSYIGVCDYEVPRCVFSEKHLMGVQLVMSAALTLELIGGKMQLMQPFIILC